jgi:hypothetical protein
MNIELIAQRIAEALNGGEFRNGAWYTEGQRQAWVAAVGSALGDHQWSSQRQGPGSGPMFSGGDGKWYPACPECGGIKPGVGAESVFMAEAIGHKTNCRIARCLTSPRHSG